MSEKKPTNEEVLQRIDQVLVILKDILQDLSDISKTLKATVPPLKPQQSCSVHPHTITT